LNGSSQNFRIRAPDRRNPQNADALTPSNRSKIPNFHGRNAVDDGGWGFLVWDEAEGEELSCGVATVVGSWGRTRCGEGEGTAAVGSELRGDGRRVRGRGFEISGRETATVGGPLLPSSSLPARSQRSRGDDRSVVCYTGSTMTVLCRDYGHDCTVISGAIITGLITLCFHVSMATLKFKLITT
jgi:hypothetical protein